MGLLAYNVFAYCGNNPIKFKDDLGSSATIATILGYGAVLLAGALLGVQLAWYVKSSDFSKEWNDGIQSAFNTFRNRMLFKNECLNAFFTTIYLKGKYILQKIYDNYKNSEVKKYKSDNEHHHIVAKKAHNAKLAYDILLDVGIGINSEKNMVWLKTGFHRRLHTDLYYGWSNSVVISAYNSAAGNIEKQKTNVEFALLIMKELLETINKKAPY